MLMVNLDDNDSGLALVSGMLYRVTGTYGLGSKLIYPPTSDRRVLTLELTLHTTLDEEQQRQRIDRLERDLQYERERMEEIQRLSSGEEQP